MNLSKILSSNGRIDQSYPPNHFNNVTKMVLNILKFLVSITKLSFILIRNKFSKALKEMHFEKDVTNKSSNYLKNEKKHVKFGEVTFYPNEIKKNEPEYLYLQERKFPPLGYADTIIQLPGQDFESVHGKGTLFEERDILECLPVIREVKIGVGPAGSVFAKYTRNEKAIILQQGTRGCTAAVSAMLMMDHDISPFMDDLLFTNLGTLESEIRMIEKAGLKPITRLCKDMKELFHAIQENGSAIVSLSSSIGGHVVVVDYISDLLDQVRLRDPYHGWEITVKAPSFLENWSIDEILQIEGPK